MATESVQCVVVTPERAVLDETVDFVAVPMYDGELGVLPGRAPMIGRLGYGEMRTQKGNDKRRLYVDGGFVQIRNNVVTLLTERAVADQDLSLDKAKSALEESLKPGASPDAQQEQLENQARARAQMRMIRNRPEKSTAELREEVKRMSGEGA